MEKIDGIDCLKYPSFEEGRARKVCLFIILSASLARGLPFGRQTQGRKKGRPFDIGARRSSGQAATRVEQVVPTYTCDRSIRLNLGSNSEQGVSSAKSSSVVAVPRRGSKRIRLSLFLSRAITTKDG